jgi:hypothetical protein
LCDYHTIRFLYHFCAGLSSIFLLLWYGSCFFICSISYLLLCQLPHTCQRHKCAQYPPDRIAYPWQPFLLSTRRFPSSLKYAYAGDQILLKFNVSFISFLFVCNSLCFANPLVSPNTLWLFSVPAAVKAFPIPATLSMDSTRRIRAVETPTTGLSLIKCSVTLKASQRPIQHQMNVTD